jgi:hypothetical protein
VILNKEELIIIEGGLNITGTMLNSIIKGISTILDLGRSLGTAIRRLSTNNICSM